MTVIEKKKDIKFYQGCGRKGNRGMLLVGM
jgi:hypothetical protein